MAEPERLDFDALRARIERLGTTPPPNPSRRGTGRTPYDCPTCGKRWEEPSLTDPAPGAPVRLAHCPDCLPRPASRPAPDLRPPTRASDRWREPGED